MLDTLAINETFGPTLQGEGPSSGINAMFLRLATCNLHCVWCDTPYTWDWDRHDPKVEVHKTVFDDVARRLLPTTASLLVVTGGEPLIQSRPLVKFFSEHILGNGLRVEIETNGTFPPLPTIDGLDVRYNVSPKLAHAGDPEDMRIKPDVLSMFRDIGAAFKFVIEGKDDLDEVAAMCAASGISPHLVWLMPQARSREELDERLGELGDAAVEKGWNVSDRMHIRMWGDERGR